jgi:hypothetical protein
LEHVKQSLATFSWLEMACGRTARHYKLVDSEITQHIIRVYNVAVYNICIYIIYIPTHPDPHRWVPLNPPRVQMRLTIMRSRLLSQRLFGKLVLVTFPGIPPYPPYTPRPPSPVRCCWHSRRFFFEKITFLDISDMYFLKLDVFSQYMVSF